MIDYHEDYYKGVGGIYFKKILDKIIKIGNLDQENGIILDFGCGHNHLKRRLDNKKVIGYDIIPDLSGIRDYRKLKPDVIVCNNILEHFTKPEVIIKIKEFKKMNKNSRLITATPTENWLSKLGMFVTGMTNAHDDHKTKLKEINNILSEYYELLDRKNVFTLCEISLWKFKP
ncbi:MAG: methyltransferase domain-containing protein [Nanoarchaeota archaeon]|mgnify:CR=1 FL=1